MARKIDWDRQFGRRLKLRDLHVFFTVAKHGSMTKAAMQLGVSPPTVSEVIADLERGLGVRLLDRSPQGVEPTMYGNAFLKRGLAITPVKFGISFTTSFLNQAGALVLIYKDGTILVNHGGTEMGQGLHTKIQQVAAAEFGQCGLCHLHERLDRAAEGGRQHARGHRQPPALDAR